MAVSHSPCCTFFFFLCPQTRAHTLGFTCPETVCLACSVQLDRCPCRLLTAHLIVFTLLPAPHVVLLASHMAYPCPTVPT